MMRTSDRLESLCSSLRLEPSGRLVLGGQEMILLPRHFLTVLRKAVGRDQTGRMSVRLEENGDQVRIVAVRVTDGG